MNAALFHSQKFQLWLFRKDKDRVKGDPWLSFVVFTKENGEVRGFLLVLDLHISHSMAFDKALINITPACHRIYFHSNLPRKNSSTRGSFVPLYCLNKSLSSSASITATDSSCFGSYTGISNLYFFQFCLMQFGPFLWNPLMPGDVAWSKLNVAFLSHWWTLWVAGWGKSMMLLPFHAEVKVNLFLLNCYIPPPHLPASHDPSNLRGFISELHEYYMTLGCHIIFLAVI